MEFETLNKDLLCSICEFLRSFDEVITNLSDEQEPTLHKVIPLRKCLINHCVPKPEDMLDIKKMKEFLRKLSKIPEEQN